MVQKVIYLKLSSNVDVTVTKFGYGSLCLVLIHIHTKYEGIGSLDTRFAPYNVVLDGEAEDDIPGN